MNRIESSERMLVDEVSGQLEYGITCLDPDIGRPFALELLAGAGVVCGRKLFVPQFPSQPRVDLDIGDFCRSDRITLINKAGNKNRTFFFNKTFD